MQEWDLQEISHPKTWGPPRDQALLAKISLNLKKIF